MVWRVTGNICFNIRAFSISFDAINILTEMALVIWPTFAIIRLHASKKASYCFHRRFWMPDTRCHCLRRSNDLHCPSSRGERHDVRLMVSNNLYGDCAVCRSHNSVHTIPATFPVELGVWIPLERRLPTSKCQGFLVYVWKAIKISQQPLSSHASRSQSVPTQSKRSLPNPENGQIGPLAIIAASGEPLRTQLGMAWDSRSGSSQIGLIETMEPAPVCSRYTTS